MCADFLGEWFIKRVGLCVSCFGGDKTYSPLVLSFCNALPATRVSLSSPGQLFLQAFGSTMVWVGWVLGPWARIS